MNIVAMIPARSGSKGIKNKNLRLIGEKPLLAYTIESAIDSRLLSRVIVSTDSEEMKRISIVHRRGGSVFKTSEISGDTACMVDVMAHCANYLKEKEGYLTDLLVTLYPTSPFRTGAQIDLAITALMESKADCLVSVSRQKHHPYWALGVDEDGRLSHYFGKEHIFYRRQDMPFTYEQNGAIYIVPPTKISSLDKRSMTSNSLAFIMEGESSLNIDDEMDLVLANALMEEKIKQDRYN